VVIYVTIPSASYFLYLSFISDLVPIFAVIAAAIAAGSIAVDYWHLQGFH